MTRYVKYVGTSHWREMTQGQFAQLPMPVEQETLRWDASNGWTVNADRITPDAWPYLKADGEFIVIDSDTRTAPDPDDKNTVNVKEYPPLTTAATAEWLDESGVIDPATDPRVVGVVGVDGASTSSAEDNVPAVAPNTKLDQSTGSVSVNEE